MKNTFTFILLLSIFTQHAFSQSQETGSYVFMNGRLRLDTDAPASFAHIYIKHKNMGGISDVNGEFSFNLPSFYSGDTLVATYVGYNPVEIPIADLIGEEINSYVLSTKVIELDEVIIYAPHKVLKEAISSLPPMPKSSSYHVKKGLITLTRQEDEDITLLEEIAFDLYYRGDVENPYGYDPTQHRRSVDHSRFPYIYSNEQKSFGLTWFFGIYMDQYVRKFLTEPDSLDLNISDLAFINEERHLVISHLTDEGVEMLFYVRERDNHLTKIQNTINSSQFGMYIGGSPFSNNVHKEYRYRVSTSFQFGEKDSPYSIKAVVAEEYSQIIEKLTGRILHNYKNTRTMKFIDYQTLNEQPKKYGDEVRLPIKGLKYNAFFWDGLKDHSIPDRVRRSLNKWGPLESQFTTTDGDIEVDRKMEKTTFNKKDQRKQSKTNSVEQFIEDLVNNQYQADYPPALTWEDIPALMEIAGSTKVIDRFPRNILSRVYVDKCQVGIVAMWLIDSIRKNEGRKPRKAWYVSPTPLLEDKEDREKTSSRSGQFIPNNSDEKLEEAFKAFSSWWETAHQLGAGKAKRINPLESSDLNWVFRE